MRARKKSVALVIETSNDYARGILRGIHDFAREQPEWSIYLTEHGRHEPDRSFAAAWAGDGIIARIETSLTADLIQATQVPTVDVSAARLVPGIPWVETDDEAITELAVDHLLDCGLRNIAYFGDPVYNWSVWRQQYFETILRRRGMEPHIYTLPERQEPQVRWFAERESVRAWLEALPKPVGIFACYDACGQQLLEICRYYDIPVPEKVAVIGVDNDKLLCELSTPALTSVQLNSRKTGLRAAELLDRMMDGKALSDRKHPIKPVGIVRRVSTDVLAVEDPHIAEAVAYIHKHARERIRVEDLLNIVPLSRRSFESRFKHALNRTPHQEIVRVRVEALRELLTRSDMSLAEIAEELEFEHPEYLSVFFKKETGMTPMEYRVRVLGQ